MGPVKSATVIVRVGGMSWPNIYQLIAGVTWRKLNEHQY